MCWGSELPNTLPFERKAALIEPVTRVYVSPDYAVAWKYSTWLLLGNFFLTLGSFLGASYTVHKDSLGYLISGSLGAILNLLIMLPLVPIVGLYGSVEATCVSYFAVFAFRLWDTRKYVRITVDKKIFSSIGILLVLLMVSPLFGSLYLPVSVSAILVAVFLNQKSISYFVGPLKRKFRL